jgi:U4/U6.U5 tri-snRNP-associated protein 2
MEKSSKDKKYQSCPYIGTIQRDLLDFDFEKICPITLSNINVYACLVCGKYYQGRGSNTVAYTHSLEHEHHLFMNLTDEKVYCLPDGYEVIDNSLNDIKYNLKPKFSKGEIAELDTKVDYCTDLSGIEYTPGCIGLNNIKLTDYVNVVIQGLCRVTDFRDFMLGYDDSKTDLVSFYI